MTRSYRVLGWTLLLAASSGCGQTQTEESTADQIHLFDADSAAVVGAVNSVLEAINTRDGELLRRVMMPDAQIVANRPGGSPSTSTVAEMAVGIADPPQAFTERMWDPRVHVDGPIAALWAPYDFYRDGTFSHCGIDAFHLLRVDGAWRVQSLVYNTLQPPECAMHPEGPPGG
jgi:hypothetical protein